ncbi:DUF5426 family protein [Mycoplasmoides pneumoniae]|uniref:DUF5426 family protein n=1 Tax=Mycoplasmoides pneumoniae TaxID=2104 RepID=UPI0009FFC6C7|nr:DUF5426 family protein [Mycoplasmoides pneumoniae]ARI11556.1 hypothetical protein B7R95_01225 [Mycoplasmoides pneumoniae]ARJ01881.1 hypothetical protein B7W90_01220 [Mycoplasmoides pneumoniae]
MRKLIKLNVIVFVLLYLGELFASLWFKLISCLKTRNQYSLNGYYALFVFVNIIQKMANSFQKLASSVVLFETEINEFLVLFTDTKNKREESEPVRQVSTTQEYHQVTLDQQHYFNHKLSDYFRLFKDKTFFFEII